MWKWKNRERKGVDPAHSQLWWGWSEKPLPFLSIHQLVYGLRSQMPYTVVTHSSLPLSTLLNLKSCYSMWRTETRPLSVIRDFDRQLELWDPGRRTEQTCASLCRSLAQKGSDFISVIIYDLSSRFQWTLGKLWDDRRWAPLRRNGSVCGRGRVYRITCPWSLPTTLHWFLANVLWTAFPPVLSLHEVFASPWAPKQ